MQCKLVDRSGFESQRIGKPSVLVEVYVNHDVTPECQSLEAVSVRFTSRASLADLEPIFPKILGT